MESLDSLLDERYEDATFHDSELLSCGVDFARTSATLLFDIQCRPTKPDQQFSLQRATVEFAGLCLFFVEPTIQQSRPGGESSLWITGNGPLPDPLLQISDIVPKDLPEEVFVHYLYSNSTNSFIVIGATGVTFSWICDEDEVH